MTGKTHKAVGVCVGIAFTYWGIKSYGDPTFALSTIASAAGAMLPDIDHNSTKLGSRRKAVVGAATRMLSAVFAISVLGLSAALFLSQLYTQLIIMLLMIILPVIILSILAQVPFVKRAIKFSSKHRGLMHTLAVPLLACLGFMLISNVAVRFGLLAMAAGYTSHLFLDCLNKKGCPILWPLMSKNVSFTSIRTGSKAEYVVSYTLAALMLAAFMMYQSMYGGLNMQAISLDQESSSQLLLEDFDSLLTWHDVFYWKK